MKRWLLWIVLVIVGATWAIAVRSALKASAKKEREARYESALQTYSRSLKPGSTRKEVEDYFRANDVTFEQGTSADLVRVGKEETTRHCRDNYVYVAFEFNGTNVLESVKISRQLGGCL
ncbi:MAG TPA: hypothetical protein VEU96_02525 [Bryobacteraceae bacterium]|nr:hypothetical protein [Bryobacteraceae bacterium]